MKKILSLTLALVMVLATFSIAISFTSATENEEKDYIDATLNEVSIDGELYYETGKWNTMKAHSSDASASQLDKATIVTPGTPDTAEYVMDKKASGCTIGAAWSMSEKMVFFGFATNEPIQSVVIEIGGKTAELDATISESVTGVVGGLAKIDITETILEMALPIEGLELYENEKYVYTNLKITVNGKSDDAFDGILQFTDYSANFVFNSVNRTVQEDRGTLGANAQPTISDDYVITLLDNVVDATNSRVYLGLRPDATITLGKNFAYEFDMTVNAMPTALPFNGGPSKLQVESPDAHMWCLVRTAYNEMFYFNIINHPNYGICMLVQTEVKTGTAFDEKIEPGQAKLVKLGCEEGEKFTLKIEWFEGNTVAISVNNKEITKIENAVAYSPNLGSTIGLLMFNTGRTDSIAPTEKIDVDISNLSVGLLNAEYDKDALLELGADITPEGDTPSGDTPSGDTPSGDTPSGDAPTGDAPSGDAPTGDAPAEDDESANDATSGDTDSSDDETEKKSGCGSSLAGIGIFASLGLALTAVAATKKKKD